MLLRALTLLVLVSFGALFAAPPRTLRVDYFHSGNAKQELFSLDQVVLEPLPWPGNPARALDTLNLGKYRFQVLDKASGQLLYSRGFCSIYGEWESTEEAAQANRTFSESLRFPAPTAPVRILLEKRDAKNAFVEVWRFELDPKDIFINPAKPDVAVGTLIPLQKSGDPASKVDFLILGDGYTTKERGKFTKDAKRFMEMLFKEEPYKSRRSDFNVWGLCPSSRESGISRPSTGQYRRTPLGCTYDAFNSERYVLTFENKAFRDIASHAPYDVVEVLVNNRTYGGGGIFGLYGTVASDNAFSPYIFVHEFGHHFAGLADEYYTSDVAYLPSSARIEPWEPNATADPKHPKWHALLSAGVPLPTPWKKTEFEKVSHAMQAIRREIRAKKQPEAVMEEHFRREAREEEPLLNQDTWSRKVGAFEGANYEATGFYRSQSDCIMFTRNKVPFCAACRAAITRVIDLYSGK